MSKHHHNLSMLVHGGPRHLASGPVCLSHGSEVDHVQDQQQDDQNEEGGEQVPCLIHFDLVFSTTRGSALQIIDCGKWKDG